MSRIDITPGVTFDTDDGLFIISCAGGYSCLGLRVARQRANDVRAWLGRAPLDGALNPPGVWKGYAEAIAAGEAHHRATGERCNAELVKELIGKEGQRVEVTYIDGTRKRFTVGKSTGWLPVHLELARKGCGGPAVFIPAGATVRVIK